MNPAHDLRAILARAAAIHLTTNANAAAISASA